MDAKAAAQRWADTWSRAWPRRDAEAITALYADTAVHHSTPFRQPGLGRAGVRRYLRDNFLVEEDIECWFGPPIVSGGRAAVEWWASWTEQGQELTYAGVSVLRFDDQGQVVQHRDYDHHVERRQRPYADWWSTSASSARRRLDHRPHLRLLLTHLRTGSLPDTEPVVAPHEVPATWALAHAVASD